MGTTTDSVLEQFIALAEQGARLRIAVEVGGILIYGTVGTAATYRQSMAQAIGHELPGNESDALYLHLSGVAIEGQPEGLWYRCPLTAVQGLLAIVE